MINHKLLLNQVVDQTINSFVSLLERVAPKQIMTLIATNNCYQFAIASEAHLVSEKNSSNRRNYNLDKASETFSIDNTRFAITGICKVIKAWWQDKAYHSKTKIIEARTTLSQVFGIFDLEVRPDWSIPENRTRRINPCMNFNAFRSACFALAAEQVLKSYGFEVFPSQASSLAFPDHKYYTSVAFYNAGLQGLDVWSGDHGFEDAQGTHWNIPELMHKQPLARTVELILDEVEFPFWEDAKAYRAKQEAGFQSPNQDCDDEESSQESEAQDVEVTREEWQERQEARNTQEAQATRQEQQQSTTIKLNPSKPKPKPILKNRLTPDIENVYIPNFAWMQSSNAIAWWQTTLENTANAWLTSHAPDWILDIVLPF